MPSILTQIRIKIDSHLQRSSSGRFFIDPRDLRSILTHNIIIDAVSECSIPIHLHAPFATQIFQKGMKVFAILVHIQQPNAVIHFLERDELDARLPFSQELLSDILREDGKIFFRSQWDFIPHIFRRGHHQHIPKSYILPFLAEKPRDELEGGFGAISEITIASSMQALVTDQEKPIRLIRKRIKAGNTEETRKNYENEKDCLELLRLRGHPNILELFASYTYLDEYNFLFPWLDMDLEQFLALEDKYGRFEQNITYLTAIEGLSSALENIHDLHLNKADYQINISRVGYHHDVRPRNILVTPNNFVLADFGLSKFKVVDAGSRTKWKENVGDYIAPECMDEDFEPQDVGRAIDIWALGGIIFDLAWHREQGLDGINQARAARQGPANRNKWDNRCFFLEDEIKPKVIQSSEELRIHSKDATTASLLKVAFLMLRIAPQKRPRAIEVRRNMTFLTVKSLFNSARERLRNFTDSHPKEGDKSPSTGFRLEITRLEAWGSVLGLNTDGLMPKDFDGAVQSIESNGRYAVDILKQIENSFKCSNVAEYPCTSASLEAPPINIEYHEERHELLHQLIEKLLKPLPLLYRKRVDQVWQQLCTTTNETQVLEGSLAYRDIVAISSIRALRLALYDHFRLEGHVGMLLPARSLELDVRLNSKLSFRTGWYSSCKGAKVSSPTVPPIQVLVERIYLPPNLTAQSSEERITRINALAELLHQSPKPKDFRVLDCLGFIDSSDSGDSVDPSDKQGFDFLYQFPHTVAGGSRLVPKSLADLFKDGLTEPALEEKINFGKALVSSIHQLHAADWLHRNISPASVVFFVADTETPQVRWAEPYLVNFRHCRPDGSIWTTDGPTPEKDYQHPEYLGDGDSLLPTRFQKRYDYYSIGIILLEVGLWQPLIKKLQARGGTPAELRNILTQKHVPELRRIMGQRYRKAVQECLQGVNLREAFAAHKITAFFEHVIEPLFEIRI